MTAAEKLVVRARSADVARAEALLGVAGAESVSLLDAADAPLFEPAPGDAPLWPEVEIHALFGAQADLPGIAAWLEQALPGAASVRVMTAGSGSEGVLEPPLGPLEIGRRLLVLPAGSETIPGERIAIRLRMGLAFGTGRHPTTRMCLEWLESRLEPGARVVDYGCGSGVLAIAAKALGASRVLAVDTDPQALEAAAANAELNGLDESLWIGRPDELAVSDCDVVLANILAIPLIGLAGTFARLLAPGGRAVLTGILDAQADGVISAYASSFDQIEHRSSDGWSLLTARSTGAVTVSHRD